LQSSLSWAVFGPALTANIGIVKPKAWNFGSASALMSVRFAATVCEDKLRGVVLGLAERWCVEPAAIMAPFRLFCFGYVGISDSSASQLAISAESPMSCVMAVFIDGCAR
jgi:hypothetical protein